MMSSRAKILFKVSRSIWPAEISPGNKVVYEKRVKPAFRSASMVTGDRLEIDVMFGR